MDIWDWLQTLLDGLLGATVGAGVAIVVLKQTIRQQSKDLAAQLSKQDSLHREQLGVQDKHHQEQLAAQNRLHEKQLAKQDEAMALQVQLQEESDRRSRITHTAGELLAELATFIEEHSASNADSHDPMRTSNRLRILLQRLYFDLDEEGVDLYHHLYPWIRRLIERESVADLIQQAVKEHGEDNLPEEVMEPILEHASITTLQVGWLTTVISSWVRSGPIGRAAAINDLAEGLAEAKASDESWLKAYPPND